MLILIYIYIYIYIFFSGNSTGFDAHRLFSFSINSGLGQNVTILGADMSSSVQIDNKNKDSFIFGKFPTNGLNDTKLTAEKECSIDFTE